MGIRQMSMGTGPPYRLAAPSPTRPVASTDVVTMIAVAGEYYNTLGHYNEFSDDVQTAPKASSCPGAAPPRRRLGRFEQVSDRVDPGRDQIEAEPGRVCRGPDSGGKDPIVQTAG